MLPRMLSLNAPQQETLIVDISAFQLNSSVEIMYVQKVKNGSGWVEGEELPQFSGISISYLVSILFHLSIYDQDLTWMKS